MAIIGSHNTMTYLPPKHWWQYLYRFTAKCQKLNYKEQYKAGARWFDLRIKFKKENDNYTGPIFAHGLMEYKSPDINEILSWLNEQKDTVYVRIILETCSDEKCIPIFFNCCMQYHQLYTNIKFTESKIKGHWNETVYDFGYKCPYEIKNAYASCNTNTTKWSGKGFLEMKNWSGLLIDDLWPWIYAKIHNKKNIKKYQDKNNIILLLDFIK